MSSVRSWFESPLDSSIAREASEFSAHPNEPVVSGQTYANFLLQRHLRSELAVILVPVTGFLRCKLPLAGRFHPRAAFQASSPVGLRILGPYQRLWHWPVSRI